MTPALYAAQPEQWKGQSFPRVIVIMIIITKMISIIVAVIRITTVMISKIITVVMIITIMMIIIRLNDDTGPTGLNSGAVQTCFCEASCLHAMHKVPKLFNKSA